MEIIPGKPYKTRRGFDVRIYAVDGINGVIHGAVLHPEGARVHTGWYIEAWYKDGTHISDLNYDIVPPTRTVWINIYPEPSLPVTHRSKDMADENATKDRTGRIKFEYVEGQFDE